MIRFALVGLGHIGRRYLRLFDQLAKQAELVAVADPRPLVSVVSTPIYSSLSDLLSAHHPDVVIIATPHYLHEELTLQALDAGAHVVCEKPMALTRSSAERMLDYALRKHRHLFLVQQLRFQPHLRWLVQQVRTGQIGSLQQISLNLYWNRNAEYFRQAPWRARKATSGGPLFTQFSHFIDLLYWLLGEIEVVQALFDTFYLQDVVDYEDSGTVLLRSGPTQIALQYTIAAQPLNDTSRVTMLTSQTPVLIEGQYMQRIEAPGLDNVPTFEALQPDELHREVIKNVIATLQGQAEPMTNALEGVKVVDLIERIYQFRN